MTINKDFARGKKGETALIELFQEYGHKAIHNQSNDARSYYDVEVELIDEKSSTTIAEFTVEVKNDEYAARSGNIALEFYNSKSNKPSGIHVTKADIWAQIAFGEIWIASVKELKKFISAVEPARTIYSGGDGNADILLYEKDRLFNGRLFYKLDGLSNQQLIELILKLLSKGNDDKK